MHLTYSDHFVFSSDIMLLAFDILSFFCYANLIVHCMVFPVCSGSTFTSSRSLYTYLVRVVLVYPGPRFATHLSDKFSVAAEC